LNLLSPPRLATTLLRWFGPHDEPIEGDLLEGFQRRSGSQMWYSRQVAIAIWVAAVREIGKHPIGVSATIVLGWFVWWVLLYQVAFPVVYAVDHSYSMRRMGQGYDARFFGPLFVYMSWVVTNAAEAITAAVAVRIYRGHRPMLALLYAGLVFARCVGSLTLSSIYYDPAVNAQHYGISFRSFPPFGVGTILFVFPVPSLAALVGGMSAASRQEVVTRSHR
jgi:hypothetical protein